MKTIWAAGAGVLLLGLAGCGNTTLKNLEADAGGARYQSAAEWPGFPLCLS
jgi:hypothetical protein